MERVEFRLSGSGGQGLITGGIILAEAAIIDGLNAVQSQSYGPEARGGASKSEVIIDKAEIDYPKVNKCDVLLSLTQESCDKYLKDLRSGGILIIDESIELPERQDIKVYRYPIINISITKLNKPMVANIVALGIINGITNVVSNESLEKAVLTRVPKGTEDLNKAALTEGFKLLN